MVRHLPGIYTPRTPGAMMVPSLIVVMGGSCRALGRSWKNGGDTMFFWLVCFLWFLVFFIGLPAYVYVTVKDEPVSAVVRGLLS
jgi:hypothetical protein